MFEIIVDKVDSWGKFKTEEDAYNFAVEHIHFLKMACGDIYIPYEIIEVEG